MEKHVGKKRRKEVRQAINMRDDCRKELAISLSVVGVGILAMIVMMFLEFSGTITMDDTIGQVVLLIAIFLICGVAGSKAYSWSGMRSEYKNHCERLNITKEDIDAYNRGEL